MQCGDFLFCYKVESDLIALNREKIAEMADNPSNQLFLKGKIFLAIIDVYLHTTGVLGRPVTFLF